ncbi:MAG: helix-turn-helix domain-containing protein [Chitinophagales bacterium]|jgi:transcriptional regulator with XRE-family HTH domain|nr:helix-turn-helix domain-containing protein [Chitinophagales bacterium]
MNTLNEKVIKKIKQVREEKKFSQEQVAQVLKMDRTTYNKLELGKTELTLNTLEAIVKVLEINIDEVLEISAGKVYNFHTEKLIMSVQGENASLHLYTDKETMKIMNEEKKK